MNDTLVLHQFAASPFSEKVRLVLGFKRLAWAAVEIPIVMPKPDVVALTGGHRRTPFLQVGADIYCDSALVAKVLERLRPQPTLYPASAPLAEQVAQWADSTLFWAAVPWAAQPAAAAVVMGGASPEALKAFAMDRAAFTAGMKRLNTAEARVQVVRHGAALERQLARQAGAGHGFLLGPDASIADFSVAHCLWFIRRARPVAGILEPFPALNAWLDRVLAFGHGERREMTSGEAVAIAAAAAAAGTHAPAEVLPGQRLEAGMPVVACATDYGTDPVTGTLVGLDDEEIVVRRTDERAGTVHVHFPRAGFQVREVKDETASRVETAR
ncbi:MAG: glutathione S-transferase family protein [Rubrivivax sp.]|nr:glutathione S-transferase family protein [Rubrivivax sp.]